MSNYIDGFVLPIRIDRVDDYRKLAEAACAIWKEHGALEYWECIGDDLNACTDGSVRSFPDVINANDDETVMFSWAVFESREARDAANAKIFADERLSKMMEDIGPMFDCARMAHGGFRTLVRG